MKIQEDLVYDKTGQHLIRFVNLGDVNEHMLTLMVRGIFMKFEFPYTRFPTQSMVHVLCIQLYYLVFFV